MNQASRIKAWDTETIAVGTTNYSDTIPFRNCTGKAAVLITSTAGQITVSYQLSNDGTVWCTPMDTSATSLGVLCTTLGVTTGTYILFSPAAGKFIRFELVEDGTAETIVTLTLVFRTEV